MPFSEITQQWILIVVLILLVAGLVKDLWRPSMLFFMALLILTSTRIITPEDMMSGFANTQIATVVLLLVIGNVINQTTIIPAIFDRIFKYTKSYKVFMSQMMLTVGGASGFMNNTPLVAMLIPYVYSWGKKHNISPSKLLMPLSYATIAGGMITLMGTSTNLIINGLLVGDGLKPFSLFDFAPIGIVVMLFVWVYMLFVGSRWLPDNRDPVQVVKEESKSFMVEMVISEKSPLAGKTVEEVSMQPLRGLFIVALLRDIEKISPVEPHQILHPGDRLVIKGSRDQVATLLNSETGLHLPELKKFDPGTDLHIVEVAVSYNSSLAHKTVKESKFRTVYGASVLAIHRAKGNILTELENIVIVPGDVLMVMAVPDALKKLKETTDLYVISQETPEKPIGGWKSWTVGLSFLLALIMNTLGIFDLFTICLWLSALFFLLRVSSMRSIQRTLDIDLILVLAFSIGLGNAIKNTGLAEKAANSIIAYSGQLGLIGTIAAVYLIANVLTQLISNAASAAIAYPVAVATAQILQVDYVPFVMAVAFGASLDFSTPIGYQTNLMIYGPGGYKFTDYIRVGLPLNILLLLIVLAMIHLVF